MRLFYKTNLFFTKVLEIQNCSGIPFLAFSYAAANWNVEKSMHLGNFLD